LWTFLLAWRYARPGGSATLKGTGSRHTQVNNHHQQAQIQHYVQTIRALREPQAQSSVTLTRMQPEVPDEVDQIRPLALKASESPELGINRLRMDGAATPRPGQAGAIE